MKNSYLVLVILFSLAVGCYPPPEYPDAPDISFNDITFYDNASGTDSLVLSINFRDGDGDLGLRPTETDAPYNPYEFVYDQDGDFIDKGSSPDLPEDNCSNYATIEVDSTIRTVLVDPNPDFYNIEVDFFVLQDGEYEFFDLVRFRPGECGLSFYGRFPLLQDDEDLGSGPIEGVLNYRMKSSGFIGYFSPSDTLRLQVRIRDRALNESNQIMTPPFTLNSIRN
ncbi:hypothetical protein AB9P05_15130 [Roseivirga sp. BDSF3-8]|uniref:hypothetical protein n=1 Tax=Roseivirga sp. BDSF3-8 TaxID=3241598 RepID=UPI0035325436